MHSIDGQPSPAGPPRGLDEVDGRGHAARAVQAGQDPQLRLCLGGGARHGSVLVGSCLARRLIDGHHDGSGDESGEERHEHHYREGLGVEDLPMFPMLSTISSTRPLVFIKKPRARASRRGTRAAKATVNVPMTLATQAVTTTSTSKPHDCAPQMLVTSVLSPLETK